MPNWPWPAGFADAPPPHRPPTPATLAGHFMKGREPIVGARTCQGDQVVRPRQFHLPYDRSPCNLPLLPSQRLSRQILEPCQIAKPLQEAVTPIAPPCRPIPRDVVAESAPCSTRRCTKAIRTESLEPESLLVQWFRWMVRPSGPSAPSVLPTGVTEQARRRSCAAALRRPFATLFLDSNDLVPATASARPPRRRSHRTPRLATFLDARSFEQLRARFAWRLGACERRRHPRAARPCMDRCTCRYGRACACVERRR